jgi:hypothetical protein
MLLFVFIRSTLIMNWPNVFLPSNSRELFYNLNFQQVLVEINVFGVTMSVPLFRRHHQQTTFVHALDHGRSGIRISCTFWKEPRKYHEGTDKLYFAFFFSSLKSKIGFDDYNNKTIDVIISVAESPTNFYFQIWDQNFFGHLKELKSFNESMDYAYNRKKCQDLREGPIINNFFFL